MGECSFWYRPTRVVPDQRPLNGRCCCCCCTVNYKYCAIHTTEKKQFQKVIIHTFNMSQCTSFILGDKFKLCLSKFLESSLYGYHQPLLFCSFSEGEDKQYQITNECDNVLRILYRKQKRSIKNSDEMSTVTVVDYNG